MANEFVIKRGYISQGDSSITGSLVVTGGVTGSFSGSYIGDGSGLTGVGAFPFTGSALITGSLAVTGSLISRITSPGSSIWVNHFSGERYGGTNLQGRVYIKTNYPFVEDFYIGKNNETANNDTSTSGGIIYSHSGVFTVRNTNTSGFHGITLNADQNLTQRVGIDTGRNGFGFGWSLRNFTNSTDYINFANNSNRVGIGWNDKTTSLLGATLDVKAQGALSTDITFRVRNSADTGNLFNINGNGSQISNATSLNTENFIWQYNGTRQASLTNTANAGIFRVFEGASIIFDLDARTGAYFNKLIDVTGNSIFRIATGGAGTFTVRDATTATSNYQVLSTSAGVLCDFNGSNGRIVRIDSRAGEGAIQVKTSGGTPAVVADTFKLYSADIVAGNAAPHFRTENGSIIKLYQQSAVTSSQGLADVLTNVGLLATGSSIATAFERLSDFQSPYHYSGNATLGTSTSSTSWIINRIDFTTPGSPITLQGTGSWDNRTSLIYS